MRLLIILMLISSPAYAARKCLVDDQGKILNCIAIEDGAKYTPPEGVSLIDAKTDGEPGGSYKGKKFTKAPDKAPPEKTEIEKLEERIRALEEQ